MVRIRTLVCYATPGSSDPLHLADKETAVLLHEVATMNEEGHTKTGQPTIVVSFDCCHSGSGTRDLNVLPGLKTRQYDFLQDRNEPIDARTKPRALDTYIDGYYTEQWTANQKLALPLADHILLAACESVQLAGDAPNGGLFSSGLLNVLDRANGEINYADLLTQVRAKVRQTSRKHRRSQTPQFETYGDFNPYTKFLSGESIGTPLRYELEFIRMNWWVKCGAAQGLPLDKKEPIKLEIQTAAPESKTIGIVELTKIGSVKSKLAIPKSLGLDKNKSYQGILRFIPADPVYVLISGDEEQIQELEGSWDYTYNIHPLTKQSEEQQAMLSVQLTNKAFSIFDHHLEKEVLSKANLNHSHPLILESIGKVVRWNRTLGIANPKSGLLNHLRLDIGMAAQNPEYQYHQTDKLDILVDKEILLTHPSGAHFAKFIPRIHISGIQQPLYIYTFMIRTNYSIKAFENKIIFRPEEYDSDQVTLPLLKKPFMWGLNADEQHGKCFYKVWVNTSPMDHQQLEQTGIEKTRAESLDWQPLAFKDDWCTQTIEVAMKR